MGTTLFKIPIKECMMKFFIKTRMSRESLMSKYDYEDQFCTHKVKSVIRSRRSKVKTG